MQHEKTVFLRSIVVLPQIPERGLIKGSWCSSLSFEVLTSQQGWIINSKFHYALVMAYTHKVHKRRNVAMSSNIRM